MKHNRSREDRARMPPTDIKGIGELGMWAPLPDGLFVWLEPTSHAKKYYVRITDTPEKPSIRVRHKRRGRRVDKRTRLRDIDSD